MCQWTFFVLRYRATTSARMAFIAAPISRVATACKSVGVTNGAFCRCCNSSVLLASCFFIAVVHFVHKLPNAFPCGRPTLTLSRSPRQARETSGFTTSRHTVGPPLRSSRPFVPECTVGTQFRPHHSDPQMHRRACLASPFANQEDLPLRRS